MERLGRAIPHRSALEEKGRLMARLLLDTNVIVRFLTGDHPVTGRHVG